MIKINKKIFFSFIILIGILTLTACSVNVSKQDAESTATTFIKSRVKFYSKDNIGVNQTTVALIKMEKVTSYLEENNWVVVAHVSSEINQTTKQGDIVVKIDGKTGKIIEFNGEKV